MQPMPGVGPPTGDATDVGLGPPGVKACAGDATAVATGVGVAAGGTPYGNETGWLRPPGAKRVALVGLGVVTAVVALGLMVPTVVLGVAAVVAAVVGEELAVAEGAAAGEGDLEPFAPALRRPVGNVLVGVAAGVTPAVAAGVAVAVTAGVVTGAAVTAGVVTGASVKDGVASGANGVTGQRPQVMAQYPPSDPSSAQAVQLPNAFYRKTRSIVEVFRQQCVQQACKKEMYCKLCTNSGGEAGAAAQHAIRTALQGLHLQMLQPDECACDTATHHSDHMQKAFKA